MDAGEELSELADEHSDDADFFLDHLARVPQSMVSELAARDPDRAGRLTEGTSLRTLRRPIPVDCLAAGERFLRVLRSGARPSHRP